MADESRVAHYRLIRALGAGGMGTVYLAEDERLKRRAAVKVLHRAIAASSQVLARFRREAECAGRLSHPNLVKVYDFGEDEGTHYLAMEHVEGETLESQLAGGRKLPIPVATKIAIEILEALVACHEAGLIHRDLKPANVMIDRSGLTRVLDLGIVKPVDRTVLTAEGARLGTPRYMTPEMIQTGVSDPRSDVYQAGLILYECLAGRPAFVGESFAVLIDLIVNAPPPPVPELEDPAHVTLRDFLGLCLAKNPDDRFASSRRALQFLDPTRRATRPLDRPDTSSARNRTTRPVAPVRRDRPAVGSGRASPLPWVAVAGVSVCLILGWWLLSGRSRPRVGFADRVWVVSLDGPAGPPREVQVADSAGGPWRSCPMATAGPAGQVRFTAWPSRGRSLWYRVATSKGEWLDPGPLLVEGQVKPVDRQVELSPTGLAVRWMTPTPVVGMLSVSSGGATTRESAPCQAHALAVHGLEPGVDVECRVRSPDGATLDSWRERLPTVQQTVADFVELLGRATDPAFFDEIRNEHAASRGGQGSSGQTLERHRALYLQRMGQLPRAAAAYGQVKDRMADTPEIDARLRSQLLKRLWDALDLEEFFRSQLKVEPVHSVASVLGPGTAAEATVPGGLEKLWSLRFDDGGRSAGRPVLPDGPGTTVVAGPAHFRERLIGFLDRTTGAPTRTSYHHPGPLAPPGGLRRACIGFRIAGGDPLERLVLRVGPPGKRGKLLACFRKSGTPALGEGSFRVDERLLSDRSLGLNVELVTSSPTRVGQGIVLDHLTLYGERILAGR